MTAIEGEIVTAPSMAPERARVLVSVMETVRMALVPYATAEQRQDALAGLSYLAQLVCGSSVPAPAPPTGRSGSEVIGRIAEIVERHATAWDARRRAQATAARTSQTDSQPG